MDEDARQGECSSELNKPAILIVCTANVCRSPLAMALLRQRLGNDSQWQVESAGTWAVDGAPAAENVRQVLAERGIKLGQHASRTVSRELLRRFHVVLTMEKGHKEALRIEFPDLADRVFLLSEMVGGNFDIQDPIGGNLSEFRRTAAELDRILARGLPMITLLAATVTDIKT